MEPESEMFGLLLIGFLSSIIIVVVMLLFVFGLPLSILTQPAFIMIILASGLIGAVSWLYLVANSQTKES